MGWMMRIVFLVFLFSLRCLTAEMTTETPLIPRELLFGNPEKTSAKISPDGESFSYLAPDENDILNVWVASLNQAGEASQVTFDRKRGVRQYFWQANNRAILFLQDKDGDENWHVYQTDLATLITRDLTPFEGVKAEIVAIESKFPDEMLIQLNQRDASCFDVYRLNLNHGELALELENPGHMVGWYADHNLKVRAAASYGPDGSAIIHLKNKEDASWREFLKLAPTESGSIQSFSADNCSLYVMSTLDGNTSRLLNINCDSGETTILYEDPRFDLSSLVLHPITHALEAIEVEREKHEWVSIDHSFKEDCDLLTQRFNTPFSLVSRDLSNSHWIVISQSDRHPGQFYYFNRLTKEVRFLFTTQPSLEKYPLSSMQPITFQARDGMTLYGYLTLPEGKNPSNLPAVLLVHGGPWSRDSWCLSPTVQWLANRGYAVFQINYRGSTGYGKEYLNAGNREWAGKMHDDLLDGKEWLIKKGYSHPDKVAIMGGSYGGYAALVGLTFTPDEFCCGIDIVGPSNLITLLKTFPPYWKPLKAKMDLRVGNIENDEEFLKSRSPLFKADQIKKPLLIGQGANDPRVKQAESDQVVNALREKNIPVEYMLFTDEGHGFVRPENRLKFFAAAELFLAKYLGGRFEQ